MREQMLTAAIGVMVLWPPMAPANDPPRTIRVTGEGKATAPPDMATIQTGVMTQAPTARAALESNNKAMEQILSTLKEHAVAGKDVQTSQFNVQPVYKRDDRNRALPEVVAYQVTNQVRVRVRQLSKLGAVLDSLVGAGSNQVSGISFGIADPKSLLDGARKEAVADAQRRAQLYAQAAGVRVGKVHTISEQPIAVPQPHFFGRAEAADMAAAVPVATGEEEFRVTVNMVFTLEDAK
jgi:uncharacterized protein YggE